MFGFVNAKQMIRVELTPEQMRSSLNAGKAITEKRSTWRKESTGWSRGMFDDPATGIVVGLRGEMAFREIVSVYRSDVPPVDVSTHRRPSKTDFVFDSPFGKKHEVKTTIQKDLFGINYVRSDHLTRNDCFWFCVVREIQSPKFVLRGWITAQEIQQRGQRKNGRGNWENWIVETADLNPISQFVRGSNDGRSFGEVGERGK